MGYVVTLRELDRDDLPLAGGKGANLGALLNAGLSVPGGFVITTEGYRAFVAANTLEADLRRILLDVHVDEPASLEAAVQEIHTRFMQGHIPRELGGEISQAYFSLSKSPIPIAVRSSATAEDLPDLSFAGQQDTYLNAIDEEALLQAVMGCWASLWTGRAICYRARNAIPHEGLALAVVVQEMVQSEVSGVLFTANPLTGKRTETVIDATFGLGEALVSGRVEPDHYVVDTAAGFIVAKTLGAKALHIQGRPGGGTVTVQDEQPSGQALPDEQILALTRLGQRAAACFGTPQDIEWAYANGQMYVVQSRPITTLYALPENSAPEPLEIYLSFGVWQGMLDPYTPLGRDMFGNLVAGVGKMFKAEIDAQEQHIFVNAGSRLFVNITGLFGNTIGRKVMATFINSFDAPSGEIVQALMDDPRLAPKGELSPRARLRLLGGIFPVVKNVIFNLISPVRGRVHLLNVISTLNWRLKEQCAQAKNLSELVAVINETSLSGVKDFMPVLIAAVASGQGISLQPLLRMAADVPQGAELVMEVTRGLAYNVTTEMDLALWKVAQVIRTQADTLAYFVSGEIDDLVSDFRSGCLPGTAQEVIAGFLDRYGMRGVGEIDIGRPRWKEDPRPVFQALKGYLQIDETRSPDSVFRSGIERAERAARQLVSAFTAKSMVKGWLVRFMLHRFRELGGLRESPKFALVQRMQIYRDALWAYGHQYVERGVFLEAGDVFFLHLPELAALGCGEERNWQALIAARRAVYQRELRRKRIPRILLSDGTAYYDSVSPATEEDENTLKGSPVSGGRVEGCVRVVFEPYETQLAPGDILVCPATDPAWTPLFLTAGGLVMEVGGMMTHGSVVAREYGIPAVVGVRDATRRLQTGQKVHLDGTAGKITILE